MALNVSSGPYFCPCQTSYGAVTVQDQPSLHVALPAAADARPAIEPKTIRGVNDSFHRLRVGDYRVMYDVIAEDGVVLVLGIVQRGDLERWIRSR
ncbi:MAG: hypothetical protein ABIZ57_04190 [Candidatus Limnocylindria bacterium]